jgi:hypothetical protein
MNSFPVESDNILFLEFAKGVSHTYKLSQDSNLTIISKKTGKVIYVFLKK